MQLGTNNLAPFLFTKLLTPTLMIKTVSSSGAEGFSPKNGVDMDNLDYKTD